MSFLVKTIFLERAYITVSLMVSFIVDALEEIQTGITFSGFESR